MACSRSDTFARASCASRSALVALSSAPVSRPSSSSSFRPFPARVACGRLRGLLGLGLGFVLGGGGGLSLDYLRRRILGSPLTNLLDLPLLGARERGGIRARTGLHLGSRLVRLRLGLRPVPEPGHEPADSTRLLRRVLGRRARFGARRLIILVTAGVGVPPEDS